LTHIAEIVLARHREVEKVTVKISLPDTRILVVGALVGAAVGAWAGSRSREYVARGEVPELIDWDGARRFAARMNSQHRLRGEVREELDASYRQLVAKSTPIVAEYTGMDLPYELTGVSLSP
jgi:hypothetical protein